MNYRLKSIVQEFDKNICKVIETLSIFQIMFFNHIYEKNSKLKTKFSIIA